MHDKMQVTRLLFTLTGTYNDMAARPYVTNMDHDVVTQFKEATSGGSNLTTAAVAGVAGNMIRPRAEPEGIVQIENGWDTPRLRFLLHIEHASPMGGASHTQVLSGYTDYAGATETGAIDPNMRLFFNNSVTIRNVIESTPMGNITRSNVSDASHLIRGRYQPTGGFNHVVDHTMRPEDIFCSLQTNMLGGEVIDQRSTFSGGIKKSRRSNGSAPSYVSKVMQAYKSAFSNMDYGMAQDQFYDTARGGVRENLVSQDGFLSRISRQNQLGPDGSLTYADLQQLDHTLGTMNDPRVVVAFPKPTERAIMHSKGQTEHWRGTNMETVASTILSHSVPSIMMDLMLTKIGFLATNETFGGEFDVRVFNAQGFAQNIDLTPYIEQFQGRMIVEVLRDLTRNNNIAISIQMNVDILGETRINISMNGQPAIDYLTPSFCDALMTPIITKDDMNLRTVASDVEQLMSSIGQDVEAFGYTDNNGGNSSGYNSVI